MSTKPDHSTGTFVALDLSRESKIKVDDFITRTLRLENPINPEYLHSTVIYSMAPVPSAENLVREVATFANFVRYEIFQTKSGSSCLTAILDCEHARNLNEQLKRLGATSAFPTYSCHLTLSYDYNGTVESLPPLPFQLFYDGLIVNPLDPLFVPPKK